jgi:F-type H+-transporting ATPase subunit b
LRLLRNNLKTNSQDAWKLLMEVLYMKFSGLCRKGFSIFLISLALLCIFLPHSVLGASGESGGGGVTVIPDSSTLIQIVNFVFLIWVLNLLLYKPIRKILARRKEKIDGLELSIETSDKDALEKDEAFAAGIKEARAKGVKEKEALMQLAADDEKKIVADINRKAQAELAEFREKIRIEAEVARESLQKEVDNFANQICQKILGRAV